ncbi:hypothetical protein J4416_05245 [Candidatus Pacearchaeota archaeon]|nr:hypothetical protein [Candidatus Pacearchaeota archaeon]
MDFPEEFIRRGQFKLHSGDLSNKLYDVNSMLTNEQWFDFIKVGIPLGDYTYVGIATAGAIIASHFKPYAMVKDKELKGEVLGRYVLIDDVCTTERSLRDAIKIIGRLPEHIFVVVDRRTSKDLGINALFEV